MMPSSFPRFFSREKKLKCPDCTLPVLANDEFCRFCNHRLKVAGAGGDPTAASNNAGVGGNAKPAPR